jgi:hypothetical protein
VVALAQQNIQKHKAQARSAFISTPLQTPPQAPLNHLIAELLIEGANSGVELMDRELKFVKFELCAPLPDVPHQRTSNASPTLGEVDYQRFHDCEVGRHQDRQVG